MGKRKKLKVESKAIKKKDFGYRLYKALVSLGVKSELADNDLYQDDFGRLADAIEYYVKRSEKEKKLKKKISRKRKENEEGLSIVAKPETSRLKFDMKNMEEVRFREIEIGELFMYDCSVNQLPNGELDLVFNRIWMKVNSRNAIALKLGNNNPRITFKDCCIQSSRGGILDVMVERINISLV